MAKKGALSEKREKLEALALTSVNFDEAERAKIRADYAAKERLMKAVDKWVSDTLCSFIRDCCVVLGQSNNWKALSRNPKKFNSELDRHLFGLKVAMRLLYEIPDHRPRSSENKPARTAALVLKHPGYSCSQLSRKYQQLYHENITPHAFERALKRFSHEMEQRLFRVIRLAGEFPERRDDSDSPEPMFFESILNILV
jgi:hypothetical protein